MPAFRLHLPAAALCLLAGPAMAETPQIDCATAEVQVEMTWCAEQDWIAADADLNDAYAAARRAMQDIDAGLPDAEQGAEAYLRDGQRAWIAFRDASCAAEGYMMHGGSAEPMVIYGCWARLSAERAGDLWMLASGGG